MAQPRQQYLIAWTFIIFLLLAGIAVLVNLQRNQNLIRQAAVTKNATMSLNPTTISAQVGQNFTLSVNVTSPTQAFYGADVVIEFNGDDLELSTTTTNAVVIGSSISNGCTTTGSNHGVLAPISSETNCTFNLNQVRTAANGTGTRRLEFGVAAFEWSRATDPSYTPSPFAAGSTLRQIARVTFRAKRPVTNSSIKLLKVTNTNCTTGVCDTTDTNIAALGSVVGEVGDILSAISPTEGVLVTTTDTSITPTPTGTTSGCSPAILPLDLNNDLNIDSFEAAVVINNFNCKNRTGGCSSSVLPADLNNDQNIDSFEAAVVINNFNCKNR